MFLWILLLIIAILLITLLPCALSQRLETTHTGLPSARLPAAFHGSKIAQISDLHGTHPAGLLEQLEQERPEWIVCTGDLYDGVRNRQQTTALILEMRRIAPVFFVTGNHEYYLHGWKEEKETLKQHGVILLENQCRLLEKNGEAIELCGIDDPDLDHRWSWQRRLDQLHANMSYLPEKSHFRILLSHRSDLFEQSGPSQADLILSGHLHGGHWRFFGHGFLQPNDGNGISFFPRYDAGLFRYNGMMLYVSRGLGDQLSVPRLFNRPELAILTLYSKNDS